MEGPPRRWGKVQRLLRSCYAEVLPLETFIGRLQESAPPGSPPEPLVQDGDPGSYRNLVNQCLVARSSACKTLPAQLSFQQVSSQNDVVARVIQRICEKKKKNVLAFGYTLMKENVLQLPCMPNVSSYLLNHTTETIRWSILWEIILSRVGDDVMMYILEHCALFMLVPPNCCYQVCGQPIYTLALSNAKPSPKFLKQKSKPVHRLLSSFLPGRFQSSKKCLTRAKCRRWNCRRQRWSESEEDLNYSTCETSVAQTAAGGNFTINKSLTRSSDGLKGHQYQNLSFMPSFKRKRESQCEIVCKRMKITETKEGLEADTRKPAGSKSQSISDGDACLKDGALNEQAVPRALESGSVSKKPCESSTRIKSKTCLPELGTGISDTAAIHLPAAESTATPRRIAKNTSSSVWKFSGVHIERHSLLHSCWPLKEHLPRSFILNRLNSYPAGGRRLVEIIFLRSKIPQEPGDLYVPTCNRRKKRLPKRYWEMRGVFQELLKNHAKCPYLHLLKKHCPTWETKTEQICYSGGQSCKQRSMSRDQPINMTGTSNSSSRKSELSKVEAKDPPLQVSSSSDIMRFLKQHNSHWQVYTFVRECLERVVPARLWGSNHNKCRFYKNVKKFICLGKFTTFSLQELMWKMRVSNCSWLQLTKEHSSFVPASEHRFREVLMSKFLYWVMDSYVRKLLQSFFYITETMFQKNLLFFFRKSIWRQLQSIGVRNHLAKVHLRALSKEEIESMQQKKNIPVVGRLRFIPKQNGLRPVVKMDSVVGAEAFCQKNISKKIYYFNSQFRNLLSILNYERIKNPVLLGSSVFGKDDIYAVWKKFVLKVLESNAEMPKFYFVKADVTGAYDTIPHDKLVEVVWRALSPAKNTNYSIRRYAVIVRSKNGHMRRYYRRQVSTYDDYCPDMKQFVCHLQKTTSLCNAVLVEQSVSLNQSSSNLYEFFLQTIHNSILNVEDRYYVQCCGIPQGFILSTLLCNLCYGDMENQLLHDIQKDGVLMRLTDDFLLVTPHLTQAKMFLRILARSIPEYGFVINPEKTVTNFSVDDGIPGCSKFKQLPECSIIPWCGLLINTQTLEIYCDYSSYACTSIRSSLSFNSSNSAGIRMRNKLQTVLQLKCHSLFLDLQINSLKTVCINVFKILLLQAYRFHACVLQLPFNQQIKKNPSFFLSVISDAVSVCFSILKAKNAEIYFSPITTSIPLTSKAVQWLTYHAFSIKLANHSVIYKCLLAPLRQCKIKLHQQIPKSTMKLLKEATELSVYGDFRAILD